MLSESLVQAIDSAGEVNITPIELRILSRTYLKIDSGPSGKAQVARGAEFRWAK